MPYFTDEFGNVFSDAKHQTVDILSQAEINSLLDIVEDEFDISEPSEIPVEIKEILYDLRTANYYIDENFDIKHLESDMLADIETNYKALKKLIEIKEKFAKAKLQVPQSFI